MARLTEDQLAYLKLRLVLGPYFTNWLYSTRPSFPTLAPTSASAPAICANCGKILGEVIGGQVATSCHECYNKVSENYLGAVTTSIKVELWPTNIDYELACVLKEIYHGRNSVLQCSNHRVRERINDIGNDA